MFEAAGASCTGGVAATAGGGAAGSATKGAGAAAGGSAAGAATGAGAVARATGGAALAGRTALAVRWVVVDFMDLVVVARRVVGATGSLPAAADGSLAAGPAGTLSAVGVDGVWITGGVASGAA